MITLKEIGKLAGVSSATVSKVINGKDENISEPTRARVLEIVEREGYVLNGIAKSLKMRKTKTIGIIVPDVMNLFFSELARSIEDEAEKKGYSVILCNSDNKKKKEEKYVAILQEKMVDGIIFTASENSNYKFENLRNIPIVLLDRDINKETGKNIGKIIVNNIDGGYIATEHLIKNGCKDIAIITSDNKNKPSAERIQGYKNALKDNGFKVDKEKVFLENYSIETGYKGVNQILRNTKVDGIFCGNDLIAIGAINALREMNISVPGDVKIVGFDDIQISKYIDPPLTTIKQPISKMGEEAVKMLISIIKKEEIKKNRILNTKIVIRKSSISLIS